MWQTKSQFQTEMSHANFQESMAIYACHVHPVQLHAVGPK